MQKFGRRVALSLAREGAQSEEFRQKARAYCEEHGYALWSGDICQEQESYIALDWVKEIINSLSLQVLLLPGIRSIHPTDIGYILNFLIEAQERHVEVICLEPEPTWLSQYTLAIIPYTEEQRAEGIASLPGVIRSLRLR